MRRSLSPWARLVISVDNTGLGLAHGEEQHPENETCALPQFITFAGRMSRPASEMVAGFRGANGLCFSSCSDGRLTMKCGLLFLGMLVASLGVFIDAADAGGRFVYRGRAVVRGPVPVVYGQPVVYGPSSMYAHPTASEYLTSPIYNPYQHPLLPVYGTWSAYPGFAVPYGDVPYGVYGAPAGYGYGW